MRDFDFILQHLVAGKYYGEFVSLFGGAGFEKKDVRPYVAGDDSRFINWKISAKHDDTYTDVFHKEEEALLHVFFDCNANWFGGYDQPYYEIIIQYFVDLVVFCVKHKVFVECFFYESDTLVAHRIGNDIIKAQVFLADLQRMLMTKKKETSYHSKGREFLHMTSRVQKKHTVLVFSDFLRLVASDNSLLRQLDQTHRLVFFRLPVDARGGHNYDAWCVPRVDNQIALQSDIALYKNVSLISRIFHDIK